MNELALKHPKIYIIKYLTRKKEYTNETFSCQIFHQQKIKNDTLTNFGRFGNFLWGNTGIMFTKNIWGSNNFFYKFENLKQDWKIFL